MGSNPAGGMHVSSLVDVVFCVGSDLCDGLITRPEESYRLCVCVCVCVCVCDLETSTTGFPSPEKGCSATEKYI